MKSSVIIALIACGTLLVAIPYIHNTVAVSQLSDTIIELGKTVNLSADLPKYADIMCILGGFGMIAVGAIGGFSLERSK